MSRPSPAPSVGRISHAFPRDFNFSLAERAAQIGYWRQEIGPRPPFWSPGLFALIGFDPDTTTPSSEYLMERIHPDDRKAVRRALVDAEATGNPFHFRVRSWNMPSAERIFDTHGEAERDADGRIIALLGVVREVTTEVEAQRRLQASEATYRLILEEATDMITRLEPDGTTTLASPAVRQILGYEPAEIIGQRSIDFAHPDDLPSVIAATREAQANGSMATFEHRRRHRDGHYVWLESRVRFLVHPQTGAPDGAIAISREIGERKEFEQELLAARERAELASKTKSRFLANMSHELRTPLNAIIGFSDIMLREMFGPIGNERYADYVRIVNESGALLLDLINDVLDMSRIEAGKYRLNVEAFDIREPIDAVVQMLSTRAMEKKIAIETRLTPPDLRAVADKRVLTQILLNLMSNAVKFTDAGGRIELGATAGEADIRLWVSDTGIGIPPEFLSRIA
ncbi:MAG: PAS domain-containing protein, partial [Alphaproteobacteria bacterium]|nr:PAS domain-containing protein [Alphaproteobacteria bacterium]